MSRAYAASADRAHARAASARKAATPTAASAVEAWRRRGGDARARSASAAATPRPRTRSKPIAVMAGGDPYDGSPRFTEDAVHGRASREPSRELRGHHVDVLVKVAERALRPPRNRAQRGVRQHERDVVLLQTGRGFLVERLLERAQHARRGGQQRVRVARRARFRNDESASGRFRKRFRKRPRPSSRSASASASDVARARAPRRGLGVRAVFSSKQPVPDARLAVPPRERPREHRVARRGVDAQALPDAPGAGERRQSLVGVVGQRALVQGVEGGLQQRARTRAPASAGVPPRVRVRVREDSTISTRASTAEASARSSSATRETPFIFSSVSAAKTPPRTAELRRTTRSPPSARLPR